MLWEVYYKICKIFSFILFIKLIDFFRNCFEIIEILIYKVAVVKTYKVFFFEFKVGVFFRLEFHSMLDFYQNIFIIKRNISV